MPLTRDKLDYMASHHYATGKRRKRPFAEPVILQGCCHDDVGCRVHFDPTTLRVVIRCHACNLFVADVATTGNVALTPFAPLVCPECQPPTPTWPRYWYRSGQLECECYGCSRVFVTIGVQGDIEEN